MLNIPPVSFIFSFVICIFIFGIAEKCEALWFIARGKQHKSSKS